MAERFLVTGASGFVGLHVMKLLREGGHEVRATDLPGTEGEKFARMGAEFVPADITRPETLRGLFDGVDYVMHIAALYDYNAPPGRLRKVNVEGTENVCAAAVRAGVKKLVYFGSCDSYGDPRRLPITESSRMKPTHNYGRSKYMGERAAMRAMRDEGLRVTAIRPTLHYGPGSGYGVVFVFFLLYKRWLPGMPGGGRARVHLAHVRDVAGAALYLARNADSDGRAYNVADDSPMRLRDAVREIARDLGVPVPRLPLPRAAAAAVAPLFERYARITRTHPLFKEELLPIFYQSHVYDNSALKGTGYRLLYPDVTEGLRETIAWYLERGVFDGNFLTRRPRFQEAF